MTIANEDPGEPSCFVPVQALELACGDTIRIHDTMLRVADDPLTLHRGLSPFDEFRLFVGVTVEPLRSGSKHRPYIVLAPDELVPTIRRGTG